MAVALVAVVAGGFDGQPDAGRRIAAHAEIIRDGPLGRATDIQRQLVVESCPLRCWVVWLAW
jgi:hypothetical protein